MIFVFFAVISLVLINAEDVPDEITSNVIVGKIPSTEKTIEARDYVSKSVVPPPSGPPMKRRRSRYLRQAPRPRRRPPFGPRTMRRPANNFPNLYGPRSRFKANPPYRSMPPPKSRYRYRDSWRPKWPEHHQQPAYIDEDEMEQDPSFEEYDDIDDYKGDDSWYSPKKYRDTTMYEDTVPTSSKYNEKRSPSRYITTFDFSRPKVRANYDLYEGVAMKDPSSIEWQDRNRYSKHYRNILEILSNGKKYEEEESMPMHRFKLANWNRLKQLDDMEYDFSGNTNNLKSRRFRTEQAVIRRPVITEDHKYETDIADISKYFAAMNAAAGLPSKEAAQEAVYSAKYRGRDAEKHADEKSKLKINNEDGSSADTTNNILHDWKRAQKQGDFHSQFVATPEKTNGVVADATTVARNQNYKDDHLSPSELIAYMSAEPGESVVGKEERYLHAAYPFSEKLSDHDILKATFPRKISPIIDQDLEITFDDRMGDWKH